MDEPESKPTLTQCLTCGRAVSDQASACPACGQPVARVQTDEYGLPPLRIPPPKPPEAPGPSILDDTVIIKAGTPPPDRENEQV